MFVTRKHLTRRSVLKGLGVTLGLPLASIFVRVKRSIAR